MDEDEFKRTTTNTLTAIMGMLATILQRQDALEKRVSILEQKVEQGFKEQTQISNDILDYVTSHGEALEKDLKKTKTNFGRRLKLLENQFS